MKKILSILCAVLIILSLCACGGNASCEHLEKQAATCLEPSKCKACGATFDEALGHSFSQGKCIRANCNEKDPDWINWYTSGEVAITKAEAEEILSIDFKKPKNVIVMIGDGMGPNDLVLTEKNKKGCFDFGLVLNLIKSTGFATTRSFNADVTDSAASGTALATGQKTNNNYVGMSPEGKPIKNISEIAREMGKKVGIVTNDDITGATPSAFTVHNISRKNYSELATSFAKFKPDVLIGQGYSQFADVDLSGFLVSKSIAEINSVLNLDTLCKKPFIGFFSEDILSAPSDTLAHLTEVALNRLKNDKGFFLMIESAGTDKAGHNTHIKGKVNSVVTFDRAVATVLKFMKENPDTLLIITSDHETGGVALPRGEFKLTSSLFTTDGHTNIDVRTFAVGYGAEYFSGKTVDNTDIAKFAIDAVKN
ncbi:MAG: alkaline phosphatase [Clostridia bacterium]|nr:alkaline phosphatase [Clostridia bacterium]